MIRRSVPSRFIPACRTALRVAAAALLLAGLPVELGSAKPLPQPPCAGPPEPGAADPGAQPAVAIWREVDLKGWAAPLCLHWPAAPPDTLVALSGSFAPAGGEDGILDRFAAVSATRGTRYWSVLDQRWRTLVTDAFALEGPDVRLRRADFTVAELASGRDLYFAQRDSRSTGLVIYRMRVRQAAADRIVIESENMTSLRFYLVTLFAAGDLVSLHFFQRRTPQRWDYYLLAGAAHGRANGHEASLVNRAAAVYRHVVGEPDDRQPPLAPD
jgi:Family of unknown function (DUF6675)